MVVSSVTDALDLPAAVRVLDFLGSLGKTDDDDDAAASLSSDTGKTIPPADDDHSVDDDGGGGKSVHGVSSYDNTTELYRNRGRQRQPGPQKLDVSGFRRLVTSSQATFG